MTVFKRVTRVSSGKGLGKALEETDDICKVLLPSSVSNLLAMRNFNCCSSGQESHGSHSALLLQSFRSDKFAIRRQDGKCYGRCARVIFCRGTLCRTNSARRRFNYHVEQFFVSSLI